MKVSSLLNLLLGPFWALTVLYGPQPLLPLLAEVFSLSETQAAALITASLMALIVGPLVAGILMQYISPRRLIAMALVSMGAAQMMHTVAGSFALLLVLRFLQGGFIALLLAGTMTYIASSAHNLKQAMAYYVAATIIGGLGGRLLAGFLSAAYGWETFFVAIGTACVMSGLLILLLPRETTKNTASSLRDIREVLKRPLIITLCGVVFCGFFVMTGLLNFMPFRLEDLDPAMGEQVISLFYAGFMVGFVIALLAPRISKRMGGSLKAALVGMSILVVGGLVALGPSIGFVFFAVVVVASGFFLTHAVVAPYLNALDPARAGLINSLYISIYYIGGSLGSYFPGFVYEKAGWTVFMLSLVAMNLIGVMFVVRARRLALRHV